MTPGPADLGREVRVLLDADGGSFCGKLVGVTYGADQTCDVQVGRDGEKRVVLKSLPVKCVRLWDEGETS